MFWLDCFLSHSDQHCALKASAESKHLAWMTLGRSCPRVFFTCVHYVFDTLMLFLNYFSVVPTLDFSWLSHVHKKCCRSQRRQADPICFLDYIFQLYLLLCFQPKLHVWFKTLAIFSLTIHASLVMLDWHETTPNETVSRLFEMIPLKMCCGYFYFTWIFPDRERGRKVSLCSCLGLI